MRVLYWVVFVIMLGLGATIMAWSLPAISAAAGGLQVFDLRPGGYSHAEAIAFLTALSPEGKALYLDVQHRLDAAYPLALAISVGWGTFLLLPIAWGWFRHVLAVPAIAGMVFDYLENLGVAGLLKAGPEAVTPEMVATVSAWSQAKATATTIAMVILLLALVWWGVRKWRGGDESVA